MTTEQASRAITLTVQDLHKTYPGADGDFHAVRGVSFTIEPGTLYSLLGPSGCGKTTTLRCIAGLETSDSGLIRLGDSVFSDGSRHLPPDRRDIGMVFQNYAIWPHLTVFENVAFPLRVGKHKYSKSEIGRHVDEALDRVELGHLTDRPAVAMSGGQQQRLALARALVRRPRLLLLDEPLSNLDAKLRDSMRTELRQLQQHLGITTLYVTHDQGEALSMSDRVAVMSAGVIQQEGTPHEIYQDPTCRFVADFVGHTNLVNATVVAADGSGDLQIEVLHTRIAVSGCAGRHAGDQVLLSIRPESLSRLESPGAGANVVSGTVDHIEFFGEMTEYHVTVEGDDGTLRVRCGPQHTPQQGDRVHLELPVRACRVVDATGETSAAPA